MIYLHLSLIKLKIRRRYYETYVEKLYMLDKRQTLSPQAVLVQLS